MADTFDLLLKGATVVNHDGQGQRDIAVKDGRIAGLGSYAPGQAAETMDCSGLHILPGVIDSQVHFREPGMEHKEDLESGSRSAVMGGVTAVFEMPNTNPLTISAETLADKLARAKDRMHCDHAFFMGGTHDNAHMLPELERLPGCCGVKVFIGSSTGNLLVEDDEGLRSILRSIKRRASFHAEDEPRLRERMGLRVAGDPSSHPVWRDEETALKATRRLVRIAKETGKRIHVLHISTGQEMDFLKEHKAHATVEVLPHHLTLEAPDCYERLGTRAQMNPPVRTAEHRERIWRAVRDGTVDVLGSDHAPHTLEEKSRTYPDTPAGMTGVQTLVPIMLDHVHAGRLTIERFVDLSSHGQARIFGIARKGRIAVGNDADFTIVDLKRRETITNDWVASKTGWTPYDGKTVTGWPIGTMIRGMKVMWENELVTPSAGIPVRFTETLDV